MVGGSGCSPFSLLASGVSLRFLWGSIITSPSTLGSFCYLS